MSTHRFRPRYRGMALGSIGLGGALGAASIAMGIAALPLATGALGIALGAAYLASPAWRITVVTDDEGLEVRDRKGTRFRLLWTEVRRVVASPSTRTCFVDGGAPERSLLVPGVGAPAPYAIADRELLFDTILVHVAADRVETVETLEQAAAAKPA
ncbi:MAG: hypothetical protein JNL83_40005 [Myxococcales bacterium]|nr:hypothetical protein [Myxococcales bacterium]